MCECEEACARRGVCTQSAFLAFDWKSHANAALLFSLPLLFLPAPQAMQRAPEAKGSFLNEQPTCCGAALPALHAALDHFIATQPCMCMCVCLCVCVMLVRFCCDVGFLQEEMNEVDEAIDEIRFQVSRQVRQVGPFLSCLFVLLGSQACC